MMKLPSPDSRPSFWDFVRRADRVAADLNVFLVVIAMGLAMLDFTFFVTQRMIDNLPPITQVSDPVSDAPAPPAAPSPNR